MRVIRIPHRRGQNLPQSNTFWGVLPTRTGNHFAASGSSPTRVVPASTSTQPMSSSRYHGSHQRCQRCVTSHCATPGLLLLPETAATGSYRPMGWKEQAPTRRVRSRPRPIRGRKHNDSTHREPRRRIAPAWRARVGAVLAQRSGRSSPRAVPRHKRKSWTHSWSQPRSAARAHWPGLRSQMSK